MTVASMTEWEVCLSKRLFPAASITDQRRIICWQETGGSNHPVCGVEASRLREKSPILLTAQQIPGLYQVDPCRLPLGCEPRLAAWAPSLGIRRCRALARHLNGGTDPTRAVRLAEASGQSRRPLFGPSLEMGEDFLQQVTAGTGPAGLRCQKLSRHRSAQFDPKLPLAFIDDTSRNQHRLVMGGEPDGTGDHLEDPAITIRNADLPANITVQRDHQAVAGGKVVAGFTQLIQEKQDRLLDERAKLIIQAPVS